MFLLHAHSEGASGFIHFLEEVVWHGVLDTLKLIPFLFLTYLLMEYIEHKAEDKAERFMSRTGAFAPLIGGALGAIPQCGFSAAASSLYAGRVISIGTLVAVFLSTSDEMLIILLDGGIPIGNAALIVLYKMAVGITVGLLLDLIIRITKRNDQKINIDAICDEDNCHCERGILHSAIHHTVTVTIFVFVITLVIGTLVFFVGEENLRAVMYDKPVISHLIAALLGLVPNCAVSVLLATLCADGMITAGTMMAGLFSGAGVGLIVLFKTNKKLGENLTVMGILAVCGLVFGLLGDLIFPSLI